MCFFFVSFHFRRFQFCFFFGRWWMPNMRGERAKRIKNYDLLLLLLSPALVKKETFFVVILLTLTNSEKKAMKERKIWTERLWSSGGERETEENNIKCNIFNEKWLIFLFVTSTGAFWRKSSVDYCATATALVESIYSKMPLWLSRRAQVSNGWIKVWLKIVSEARTSCTLIDLYLM